MSVPGDGERLPCGAEVDELLEQVADGRADDLDAHQQACPHCRAALGEYQRLWAPVREAAAAQVRAPAWLLEDAIRRIRGTAADPEYGVLSGPDGTTRIAARVVVVTARETAQAIAGVRVVLGRLLDGDGMGDAIVGAGPVVEEPAPGDDGVQVVAGVAGRSTAIELILAADYGTDLVALGERIRREVGARVRDLTGLEPVAVTVRIDDVFT